MARMQSAKPARKVTAATLAAALATILVWVLNTFVLSPPQQIGPEVAGSITTVLVALAGYFTPPAAEDQVVP
ncbi:MAG: hypothetical protein ACM37V_12075 [Gemmatimonadota bacterium]